MHEMSLCESILEIMEQHAQEQHHTQVKTVWLEIGALSSVEPKAMRFCFPVVMQGSLAANAQLEIVFIKGQAWCLQCCKNVTTQQRYDIYSDCGSANYKSMQAN